MQVAVIGNPGSWSTEKLADSIEALTGYRMVVDLASTALDLESGSLLYRGEDLSCFDALVVKKISPEYSPGMLDRVHMLELLANRGVRVFSSPTAILAALNRLACTVRLRTGGIPMPPTPTYPRPVRFLPFPDSRYASYDVQGTPRAVTGSIAAAQSHLHTSRRITRSRGARRIGRRPGGRPGWGCSRRGGGGGACRSGRRKSSRRRRSGWPSGWPG